jgi:hypothetical protein
MTIHTISWTLTELSAFFDSSLFARQVAEIELSIYSHDANYLLAELSAYLTVLRVCFQKAAELSIYSWFDCAIYYNI